MLETQASVHDYIEERVKFGIGFFRFVPFHKTQRTVSLLQIQRALL
jgi:hypothetical protein